MTSKNITAATLIAVMSGGVAFAQENPPSSATFVDAKGEQSGTAELTTPAAGGVLIRMEISGLPASQWVAVHVHETGECDASTQHESAGGHFNPGSKSHGYQSSDGPHAGDMPNQYVGADGVLRTEIHNPMISLDKNETGVIGRALMVHAKPDDYKSQPSGDAGQRLACGVIR
ncbi:superoxide dismutase family protein [Rhizobium sp. SL86]|uniref:superoxide dismutase family protein n=1 Tax=Rhizobium sp. SL86 TaxID=2995148 RepID=UPI002274D991|nr:superoxide dismutase family protein [Rhizobium sp. SL86]MCY1666843.1 superoxide dismutase family protein [Rhizobium sp. SL86]